MTTIRAQRCRSAWRRNGATVALAAGTLCGVTGFEMLGDLAPTAAAAPARPDTVSVLGLRLGSSGDAVRAVQQRLLSFGYVLDGGADGIFGPSTEGALEHFQGANGLNPTGVVTENTAQYLGFGGGTTTPSNTSSSSDESADTSASSASAWNGLQRGATGEGVRELQQALTALGLVIGPIDGIFGPATERGVRAVQVVNGLPQTGVVEPRVAELLGLDGTANASNASTSDTSSSSTTTTSTESESSTSESNSSASASSTGTWGGLAPGSNGDGVRELQQELRGLGLVVNDRAGVYGESTASGVRAVQRVNGLTETGVVDAGVADLLGLDGTPDASDASTSDTSSGSSESDGSATSSAAAIAVAAAKTQVGVPYSFARAAPGVAFDCSGLTKWAWARAGVYLPHYSAMQYAMTTRVSVGNAQPGDLLFFHSPISHVTMYIGNGLMIQAPEPGAVVSIARVQWSNVVGIGRPG